MITTNRSLQLTEVRIPDWYDTNPNIGRNHRTIARDFIKAFPIGSEFSWDDFCAWAEGHGKITRVHPESMGWQKFVNERNLLKYNISAGGRHIELGEQAFEIQNIPGGRLRTVSVLESIAQNKGGQKLNATVKRQQKRLKRLMNAIDWSTRDPVALRLFELRYRDLTRQRRDIQTQNNDCDEDWRVFEAELEAELQASSPTAAIESSDSDDDNDDDADVFDNDGGTLI